MGRFRDFVDFVLAWFFPTGLNVTDQRFALFAPLYRERESKVRATWEEWTPRVRLAWGGTLLAIQRQRPEWKQTTFPCDFWRKKKKKKFSRKYYGSSGDNYNREERSQTKERKLSQKRMQTVHQGKWQSMED